MHRFDNPAIGALLALAFLAAGSLPLEARDRAAPLNNPAYIEVDIDAEAELENARRLVLEGRLADAVSQYLQVRGRYPDKLHLLTESPGRFQLFVPVRVFIDRTLAHLPAEARKFHLEMVDPEAAARFEIIRRSGTPGELKAFVEAFGSSSMGTTARILWGDRLAEDGRLLEALFAWEPLLAGLDTEPGVVRRLAFAYFRQGRFVELRRLVRSRAPGAEAFAPLLGKIRTGGPGKTRALPDPGEARARLQWFSRLRAHDLVQRFYPGRSFTAPSGQALSREFAPLFPAVARGVLYLNPGKEQEPPQAEPEKPPGTDPPSPPATYPLVAIHLRTGSFVSGPTALPPGPPSESRPDSTEISYFVPRAIERDIAVREPRLDLTAHGERLYAIRWVPGRLGGSGAAWRLAALDLGAVTDLKKPPPLLWEWEPGEDDVLAGPSPAVGEGRVYVTFSRVRERDVFHYVAAIDERTGDELWRTFVSAHPHRDRSPPGRSTGPPTIPQPSPPRLMHGRVFLATNHGTLASLDAETGRMDWALRYAIPTKDAVWFSNPLEYTDGVLLAAPKEFSYLIAIDPPTGRPLWSIWDYADRVKQFANSRLTDDDYQTSFEMDFRHLLGVRRGRVVFTSRRQVWACDATDTGLAWLADLQVQITGRGMVTDHRVYVPTRSGVVVLDLETGRWVARDTPEQDYLVRWSDFTGEDRGALRLPKDFEGGNLLILRSPHQWCFKRPEEGGTTCRGLLVPDGGGETTCSLCGRKHDAKEEVFLVAAGRNCMVCFSLETGETGKHEGGRGREGEGGK
ncbi:MAG: outer membrane protein assembly factor BamB family protein [Planctomycetota bacterium]|jgi:outer membrane protein assembly factor BamB